MVDKSIINQSFKYRGIAWVTWFDIATLGPEERPILSQRDEGWAKEWLYFHQPASQPVNQPTSQPPSRPPILQNIQNGISQQPLIRYSTNFKLKLIEQTKSENYLK